MKRLYRIEVAAKNLDKFDVVESWLKKEWDFHNVSEFNDTLYLIGEGWIVESEGEFADRIANAVWIANDSFCEVEVRALRLDGLPYNFHKRDKNDYEKIATPIQRPRKFTAFIEKWQQEQNDFSCYL